MISLSLLLLSLAGSPPLSGVDVVEKSIEYHDPNGLWHSLSARFELLETRPDDTERDVILDLDVPSGDYHLRRIDSDHTIDRAIIDGKCRAWLDGDDQFSTEIETEQRLSCEQVVLYRDYYRYLWGLPMNLTDPGTIIHTDVTEEILDGEETLRVRVTYDPEVGSDVWYFYFDPETSALRGARFHHDESANDGELILFDGEHEALGMRLPKRRRWHLNADGKFLGEDVLVSLTKR